MARIRTIKPDFFTSEDIVGLSPLARLLYVATWMEADREGRMVWRPGTLKLRYLPGDDCDVLSLAKELIDAGLVVLYETDGLELACIPSFTRHQVINNRETQSELPEPPTKLLTRPARVTHALPTRDDATSTPLVGKEGKGKEGSSDASLTRDGNPASQSASKSRKATKTAIPSNFNVSERVKAWALEKGFDQLDAHAEHFISTAKSKAYTYADWDEAFMTAVRSDWAKLRSGRRFSNGQDAVEPPWTCSR